MTFFKKLMLGATMALSLATAQATQINVGGVVWDPDSPLDFNSASVALRQVVNADGSLTGFGVVTTINGKFATSFCPGCQLTFLFNDYVPAAAGTLPTTPGQVIGYTGGSVKVYVNHDASTFVDDSDASTYSLAQFGIGDLFLDMTGHTIGDTTFTGTVSAGGLTGVGSLDVIGGLAQGNFDTNTRPFGADMSFTASFSDVTNFADAIGTGNFKGNTIPEPASLALAGLALLGAGAARRRKA